MKRERITGELFDYDWKKQRFGWDGRTLGSYRAETTNGVDLVLDTPDGLLKTVSLAPFADANPDHFLVFTFVESREDEPFDEGNPRDRNAVVLAEYDLPAKREPLEIITPPPYGDGSMLTKYGLPPGVKMIGE